MSFHQLLPVLEFLDTFFWYLCFGKTYALHLKKNTLWSLPAVGVSQRVPGRHPLPVDAVRDDLPEVAVVVVRHAGEEVRAAVLPLEAAQPGQELYEITDSLLLILYLDP